MKMCLYTLYQKKLNKLKQHTFSYLSLSFFGSFNNAQSDVTLWTLWSRRLIIKIRTVTLTRREANTRTATIPRIKAFYVCFLLALGFAFFLFCSKN